MKYEHELKVALSAAREAGAIILSFYQKEFEVIAKTPEEFVTSADLAADARIKSMLLKEFPHDAWLSEETADSFERLSTPRVWIVDPLDGTHEFMEGSPDFTVCIALVEQGESRVAVVYRPFSNDFYFAVKGEGAFINHHLIRCRPENRLEEAVVATRDEGPVPPNVAAIFQQAKRVDYFGSAAYKIVLVAAGRAEVYLSPYMKSEWDICAAHLVLTEAGGRLTDWAGNSVRYNQPVPEIHPGIIVTNGPLHPVILAQFQK
jgi:myo-inositol-1(or 4)-monophosphatase